MPMIQYLPGDLVFSDRDILNDGGIPDVEPQALLTPAGVRGVVIKAGSVEASPEIRVYLVRFEGRDGILGPPIGCLGEDLTQEARLAVAASPAAPARP